MNMRRTSLVPPFTARPATIVFVLGLAVGAVSFIFYFMGGLTVAHYDAKAHLVVARRIVAALEPGYAQMGAQWLPLVHILYLPFTLLNSQYRSGLLPSLLSVFAFALSVWLVYRIAVRVTASVPAGIFAAVLLMANPNLQYLQSCPMTEPIYMALMLLALDALLRWRDSDEGKLPWSVAVWGALGALCRYEGWYFMVGVVLLLFYDARRRHFQRNKAVRGALLCAGLFLLAVTAHFIYIYAAIGDSFLHKVAGGNPAPYETYKRPLLSALYHFYQLSQMAAIIPLIVAFAGIVYCVIHRRNFRAWAPLFLLWLPSLINISALYWGLVYRVRYSVLLLPAVALFASLIVPSAMATRRLLILCSAAAMILPWLSYVFPHEWHYRAFLPGPGILLLPAAALGIFLLAKEKNLFRWPLLVLCLLAMNFPALAFDDLPMLVETREHDFMEPERQKVIQYLRNHYDGTRILIDMGRQAPLVYDSGLNVREFVYNEGGKEHWRRAFTSPGRDLGWLCVEEGDEISRLLQVDRRWGQRYSLALQTEHLSLYRVKSKPMESLLPDRQGE